MVWFSSVRFGSAVCLCSPISLCYVDIGHGQRCLKNDKWTGTIPYHTTLTYYTRLSRQYYSDTKYMCLLCCYYVHIQIEHLAAVFHAKIHLFYFYLLLSFFLSSFDRFFYTLLYATSRLANPKKKPKWMNFGTTDSTKVHRAWIVFFSRENRKKATR